LNFKQVAFSIDQKKALTQKKKNHYKVDGYHFKRILNILPLLDGREMFFVEACKEIGSFLMNLDSEIDYILYLNKDSDRLFCQEVSNQSLPARISLLPVTITYNTPSESPKVNHREDISLEAVKI
jgi:hypothetical protein